MLTECRRVFADVNSYVKHCAFDAAYKFAFGYMACADNAGLASRRKMTSTRCLARSGYYAQGWALPFDLRSSSSLQGKVQTSLTLLLLHSSVHRIPVERSSRRNSRGSL